MFGLMSFKASALSQTCSRILILCLFAPGMGSSNVCLSQPSTLVTVTEAIPIYPVSEPNSSAMDQTGLLGQSVSLSLEELEAIALQCHPSVQRARALANAARGRAFQVGLAPNPSVGFSGQQLGSDGRAEQYGVTLGQDFVVREKLSLNRATILQEVRQLEQNVVATQQKVLNDVRIGFYRVLRAQQQMEANRQLVELSEKGVTVAEALLKAQEVGRVDSLQAAIEVESAKMQLQNAENRYSAAWQELAASSGQTMLTPQPLAGDLFAPAQLFDFNQELMRLQQQSPELYAIVASIERARINLSRQQIETKPNVSVQGLFNWRDNGVDGNSNAALAVSIPIPVRNKNQGAIQDARYQVYAAEHHLTQRQLELRQRLANVFERYNNAQQQVGRYRDAILPKAEETLDLIRKTYEVGEVSFISLLTVQRTYIQSRLAYLESLESLRVAEVEIQGLLLRNGLSE